MSKRKYIILDMDITYTDGNKTYDKNLSVDYLAPEARLVLADFDNPRNTRLHEVKIEDFRAFSNFGDWGVPFKSNKHRLYLMSLGCVVETNMSNLLGKKNTEKDITASLYQSRPTMIDRIDNLLSYHQALSYENKHKKLQNFENLEDLTKSAMSQVVREELFVRCIRYDQNPNFGWTQSRRIFSSINRNNAIPYAIAKREELRRLQDASCPSVFDQERCKNLVYPTKIERSPIVLQK